MISIPDTATLHPQVQTLPDGHSLFLFPSDSTPLMRIDLLHEAGSAYQPQLLCAAATEHLFTVASDDMDAAQVSEFMDYRGIIVEHSADVFASRTTFYFLRRYFDQLLPVLQGLLRHPAFPQEDFDIWRRRKQYDLQERAMKTREVARRLYYQTLFGTDHPLGRHAEPVDADRLMRDTVVSYFRERYAFGADIVLSGSYDPQFCIDRLCPAFVPPLRNPSVMSGLPPATQTLAMPRTVCTAVPGAVQTSLRIGRILPLQWDDPEYAMLMLLTTILGGYFGSRLMGNLREDKGYTYGIYAHTQIYRGTIVFLIMSDVAGGIAKAAEDEVRKELQRLCDSPVGDAELHTARQVVVGDFLRSVDGIFERAERFCNMHAARVDEHLTDNLRAALAAATPSLLQETARRWLCPDQMLYCRAGTADDSEPAR